MLRKLHYALCLWFATLTVVGCSYTNDLPVFTRKQAVEDLDYLAKKVKLFRSLPGIPAKQWSIMRDIRRAFLAS